MKDTIVPKFKTTRELSKLTRAEITEQLEAYGLEWHVFRRFDDEPDPFLTPPPQNAPTREDQEFACNVSRLRSAPFNVWIEGLTASQVNSVARQYKINLTTWQKRSSSIVDLRRHLAYGLFSEVMK